MEFRLDSLLAATFNRRDTFVHEVSSQQVWLNYDKLAAADIDFEEAEDLIIEFLRTQAGVYDAFTYEEALAMPAEVPFISELRRGLYPRRSGDIFFTLDPAWHADDKYFLTAGTTHGSPFAYDTHVPLLWYGWRIPQGESHAPVSITDIAPTLAAMLRIMEPNGTTGTVIREVVK
jgi:hypothetical protein